jgi:hypothetical protein
LLTSRTSIRNQSDSRSLTHLLGSIWSK